MPDIIKRGFVVKSEETVMIPSGIPDFPQAAVPEENEEPAGQKQDYEAEGRARYAELEAQGEEYLRSAGEKGKQILEDARKEAIRLKQQARSEGFDAALQEKRTEIENCLRQVEVRMEEMQASLNEFTARYAKELGSLVLEITEKVICHRLDEDDLVLAGLVKKVVLSIKKADWIKVEVSDQLPGLVDYLQKELRNVGGDIEVSPSALPKGACVVQTPEGTVDASVDTQLRNLKEQYDQIAD